LNVFVQTKRLGVIRKEPFQMKPSADLPGRSPDVMFVASANVPKLRPLYLDGPADVAVEIVSPTSVAVDRGEKFDEYEQGGVREYWLIDPLRKQAEFYQRGEDGLFRLIPIGADGAFRSATIPGLWLKVAWLWDRPDVLEVFREWGVV
jgi:Uma2 family endonuclease